MPVEHKSVGRIFSDLGFLEYNLHFALAKFLLTSYGIQMKGKAVSFLKG